MQYWIARDHRNPALLNCGVMRTYRCNTITGDRFSGQWVRQSFARRGVSYIVADRTRSEFYVEILGPLNQARCDLPRNPTLIRELKGLERRTTKSGRDESQSWCEST
jgi:hypothetical protein